MARKTKARGKAAARRVRSGPPVDAAIDQLQALKLHLQATREKLMLIQPDTLNDEQHAQWSEQIYQVSLAINAVRKALLGTLSGAFAAALPELERSTNKLTDDLYRLQSATDVINAVSSALGVIASIAALVA
jgi:hypothetical protein